MTCRRTVFPFTAIVGQERMKKALILNAINPNLGGVLIRGQKGTAKSTAARALTNLLPEIEVVKDCPFNCNPRDKNELCAECIRRKEQGEDIQIIKRKMRVIELPLGATEDRVVGTLDIEHAIKKGEKIFEPGILAAAHRGILYVDEVNLLDDHLVDVLLDSAAMGYNYVEREGVSFSHPARFILIGTMNPEEGELRPQLLDRFGLCVEVQGISDSQARVKVVERCIQFERDPHAFEEYWEGEEKNLSESIVRAQGLFPGVTYSKRILRLIADIAIEMGVDGHRADISMLKVAKSIAGYHQRTEVTEDDVKEAAEFVLSHRMRRRPFQEPGLERDKLDEAVHKHKSQRPETSDQKPETSDKKADDKKENSEQNFNPDNQSEVKFNTGEPYQVKRLNLPKEPQVMMGTGRRSKARSDSKSGRYVGSTFPEGKTDDIAFDATIRTAVPHQINRGHRAEVGGTKDEGRRNRSSDLLKKASSIQHSNSELRTHNSELRGQNDMTLLIKPQDIRQKVREKKIGNTVVFVVDSSGSMGANKRMVETKGAILSLLVDAYQKRDRVGMVAFKGDRAEVILHPTSSVELAKKKLEKLPTGGKTPLSKGLLLGYEVLHNELNKNKKIKTLLVVISDGRANVSIDVNSNPFDEARRIAKDIKHSGIKSLVIDTEMGLVRLGRLEELSRDLGGMYYSLESIKANDISNLVRESME